MADGPADARITGAAGDATPGAASCAASGTARSTAVGAAGGVAPRPAVFPSQPGPDECHVWAAAAGALDPVHDYLLSLLDPAERACACRYRSWQAARLFVASRAAQRILAGRYLGRAPGSVIIDRRCRHCGDPEHGRPVIAGIAGSGDGRHRQRVLDYSVTHAGQLLLLAYVSHGLVGIDAERADRRIGTERLARYALSPAEAALVSAAPGDQQRVVFCRLWTRKEAVLKLTGHGLAAPLRNVDVTADTARAGLTSRPLAWPADPVRLTDLDLGGVNPDTTREYIAAVAATGPARRVTIRPATGFLAPPIPPASPESR